MIKSRLKIFVCATIVTFFVASCHEFFEKDLKNETVVLDAPADKLITKFQNQTFWWEYLDRADNYNLKIVSPSFANIEQIVLDTNLTINKFTFSIPAGSYEWGVSAFNFSSATAYTTRKLTIDTTSNLANFNVQIVSPLSHYSKSNIVLFQWQSIGVADSYHLELHSGDWDNGQVIKVIDVTTDTTTLKIDEGKYYWGVQAKNKTSSSIYSKSLLYIDHTPPQAPILVSPANGTSQTDTSVLFKWRRSVDAGSPIYDSLYIYSDASNTIIENKISTTDTTNSTKLKTGDHWWRVRTIDLAGNAGAFSGAFKLTIY